MKIKDLYVVCVKSIHDEDTFYIFRANGIEVKIILSGDKIKSNKELTELELDYINTNLK
ncbi:hypothetical protein [Flavobacterium sp. N2820]|uniref:hypothetical protein n=1 Tax=Flavobacterium sp. N2820 TaxID=2986834 RepID=UPI002224AEFF|nr:hypothetical protein [Flavobacterium sp. N2820]